VLGGYFQSAAAKFPTEDLSASGETLRNKLDFKSFHACNKIGCCSKRAKRGDKGDSQADAILQPLTPKNENEQIRNEVRSLNLQRLILQKQKLAMDHLRAETKQVVESEENRLKKKEQALIQREQQIQTKSKKLEQARQNYTLSASKLQAKEKDMNLWEKELEKTELELEQSKKNLTLVATKHN